MLIKLIFILQGKRKVFLGKFLSLLLIPSNTLIAKVTRFPVTYVAVSMNSLQRLGILSQFASVCLLHLLHDIQSVRLVRCDLQSLKNYYDYWLFLQVVEAKKEKQAGTWCTLTQAGSGGHYRRCTKQGHLIV